jgi:hypothetical protein
MKKKKRSFSAIALSAIVAIVGYNYIYQDHRDIQSEKPAYTLNAASFVKEFQINEAEATAKYLNKTIEIEGTLSSIDGNTVVVDNVIFFALSENETPPTSNHINTPVQIKARCIGYDNLLEEVKLDQATLRK